MLLEMLQANYRFIRLNASVCFKGLLVLFD